jgi:uncharacterized protein (TIRG00374 family)
VAKRAAAESGDPDSLHSLADAEPRTGASRRPRLRALAVIRLAVAVGILVYLLRHIPISQVIGAIARADRGWLVAAAALALSGQGIIARRLRLLSDELGLALTTRRILEINVGAMFYGLFMPAANLARSAVRLYAMARPTGRILEAMSAVFFDRVAATQATAMLGLVAFWPADVPGQFSYVGWIFAASIVALLIPFAALTSRPAAAAWRHVSERIGFPWGVKKLGNVRTSLARLQAVRGGTLAQVVAFALAAQTISLLAAYSLASALEIDIGILELAWVVGAVRLLVILPISPSGLGVREGALVVLLGAYGVRGQDALAFSLLGFATSELLIGLIGGLVEGKLFLRPRHG